MKPKMSKRGAGSELNADNWDEEDEPEEAGEFKHAGADQLAKRQILKAKRRGVASADSSEESSAPKAFAGFGGFTGFKPAEQKTTSVSSGLFSSSTSAVSSSSVFASSGSGFSFTSKSATNTEKPKLGTTNGHSDSAQKSAHMQQLKALNEGVLQWIQKHVTSNPHCILTPIFKDYETHLEEINKKHPLHASSEDDKKSDEEATKETTEGKKPLESAPEEPAPAAPSSGFSFGAKSSTSVFGSSSTPFSFGASNPPAAASSGFSFAVNKPAATEEAAEEEYEPPKPEVSQINEVGATFSKKCKLFYQKDGSWKDRGVGFLHLKPCDGKTQLIIRADTNLGNILLNIMLNSSLPMSRQGKNNVTLICVPNPPLDEKDPSNATPVSMLLRVKTADEADELLEKLKEASA